MIRKTLASTLLAISAATTVASLAPSPAAAVTVTVPNYIECSTQTGKCVQMNGAYDRRYPTHCHWVFRAIWGGNRSSSLCDRWV